MIKLEVKFDLPIDDGELNAEKLDNWIRQIDVYCRVQSADSEKSKIQLADLHLQGTTLVWWEGRTQADLKKHGKILSVWSEFVSAIKKEFYLMSPNFGTIWAHFGLFYLLKPFIFIAYACIS